MQEKISPAAAITGDIVLPGDKSISHRYALIAAIAEGETRIRNYSTGADCHSTLGCVRALGIEVEGAGTEFVIRGRGLEGLRLAAHDLDAGNSGSTIRMLSGILAAQPFRTRIGGDESLSRRPMRRVMRPLAEMGARIGAREDQFPPLEIHGAKLRAIDYTLPVASAQVKTCVLLSSAAFFIVAALVAPGSKLAIRGVGLNPTRSALLDFLTGMGARIRILDLESRNGELVGDLLVEHSELRGGEISGGLTAALIDEIPVLAVMGAATEEGIIVRDASELRVKETDRIRTVVDNLRRMGVQAEELPDGMVIPGRQRFHAAGIDSFGDHRIAMAFAVAALSGDGESVIHGAEAASVSFPEFWETLGRITSR